jgi:hypothetical protein
VVTKLTREEVRVLVILAFIEFLAVVRCMAEAEAGGKTGRTITLEEAECG